MQHRFSMRPRALATALTVTILAFVLSTQSAHSQKLFFIFGHLAYENPGGNGVMQNYRYGIGGEAGAGIKLYHKTYATGTIGYSSFTQDKSASPRPGRMSYVPVRFGLRQNFLPLNLLFLHADVGTASVKNDLTSGSRFTGSFGVGGKLGPIEAQIDYELMGKKSGDPSGANGWVGFKAGWRFGL